MTITFNTSGKGNALRRALYIMLLAAALVGLMACGMNGQEPGSATAGLTNAPGTDTSAPVGMSECLGCHSDTYNPSSLINVVGDSAGSTGWINGPHANNNNSPRFSFFSDDTCATCHDQLGEGNDIAAIEAATGLDLGGSGRPIVVCESCHGSGANHFGTGTVEYTRPNAERCGQCHNENLPHESSPGSDEIYEKYSATKHGSSINDHNYEDAGHTLMRARCSKCHTDEGAQIYKDLDGGHDELVTLFANEPALDTTIMDVNVVQCRTCHNPHNPSEYLEASADDGFGNIVSSGQYNTCTNCHQMADSYHGEKSGHSWSGPPPSFPVGVGGFDPSEIIYDTHVDNPDTAAIEGYVINSASDRACGGCHDVHEAEINSETPGHISINEQWGRSQHAGFILDKKEIGFANIVSSVPAEAIANLTALINGTDTTGSVVEGEAAFAHYNFKNFAGGSCRRCHTSSGFKYMAETGSQPFGPASMIGFATTGDQREMIYCWACHKVNEGESKGIADYMRGDTYSHGHYAGNSLIFNSIAPYSKPADRINAIGDLGASNVCMACHSGRATGQDVAAIAAGPVASGFTNSSFVNSHYLAAGGVIFRTLGYEMYSVPGAYDDYIGYAHGTIATGAEDTTWGDNGPCVACHMKHEEGHTMEAVEITGGLISNIPAYDNTCSLCHSQSKSGLASIMDTQKAGFTAALAELESALATRGMHYYGRHPYIYSAAYDPNYTEAGACTDNQPIKNWQASGSNTYSWIDTDPPNGDFACVNDYPPSVAGTAGTGANNMGAAFVYVMLEHEPGAYVHNSLYTRRLIFDSIDWLDNNSIDGTISVSEPALTYLGGGVRP